MEKEKSPVNKIDLERLRILGVRVIFYLPIKIIKIK
jgi:hypothetical protein